MHMLKETRTSARTTRCLDPGENPIDTSSSCRKDTLFSAAEAHNFGKHIRFLKLIIFCLR